jgi:3-polyprenyl-4-hydroxybenzoate decarboxylase
MNASAPTPRLIVAITGASGAIYGVRLLEQLRASGACESHLVISSSGVMTAQQELGMKRGDIEALADVVHNVKDIGATIASGSFQSAGMVIAPCSMKTLASIAHGLALLARETPLNLAHLRNMTSVTEMGGIIFPPVPAFYTQPQTIDDIVNHTVGRLLDLFSIPHSDLVHRWEGMQKQAPIAGQEP